MTADLSDYISEIDFFYSPDFISLSTKQKVGIFGQMLARGYLLKHGFEILTENYHTSRGEIDIVARKQEKLHFVEVKARTSEVKGVIEESIHFFKKKYLYLSAYQYMSDKGWLDTYSFQIDAILITLNKQNKKAFLKFFTNIVDEPY